MAIKLDPSKTEAIILSVDTNDNAYRTTIKNINSALLNSNDITGWQTLNTNIRALLGLTTQTYKDTEVVNTYSLEEVLDTDE